MFKVLEVNDLAPEFDHFSHDMYLDPYGLGVLHAPTLDHRDYTRKIVEITSRRLGGGPQEVIVCANLEVGDIIVRSGQFNNTHVDMAMVVDAVIYKGPHFMLVQAREQFSRDYPSMVRRSTHLTQQVFLPCAYNRLVERDSEEWNRLRAYFV